MRTVTPFGLVVPARPTTLVPRCSPPFSTPLAYQVLVATLLASDSPLDAWRSMRLLAFVTFVRTLLLSGVARCPSNSNDVPAIGNGLRFGFCSMLPRSVGAEAGAAAPTSPGGRRAGYTPPTSPSRGVAPLAPSPKVQSPTPARSTPSSPHRAGRSGPAASDIWRDVVPELATSGVTERWCFLGMGASGHAPPVESWPVYEMPSEASIVVGSFCVACCFESLLSSREGNWLCVRRGSVCGWARVDDHRGDTYLVRDAPVEGEAHAQLLELRDRLLSAVPEVRRRAE